MKHLSILTTFFLFSSFVSFNAQVDDPLVEDKAPQKFRFGIMGYSTIGWLNPENEKLFSRGEFGIGFGWGLNIEKYINATTSFRTGFSLSNFKGSVNYIIDPPSTFETFYVLNELDEFQEWGEQPLTPPSGDVYQLKSRKFNISYVNVPLILKLKTKEIGYFTYFGEFGGTISFNTKAELIDNHRQGEFDSLYNFTPNVDNYYDSENTLNIDEGTQAIRAGLSVGAGAEYNFSGSTALFFQVNWNYFMTNLMVKEDKEKYLRTINNVSQFEPVDSKSIPGSVNITIGILF